MIHIFSYSNRGIRSFDRLTLSRSRRLRFVLQQFLTIPMLKLILVVVHERMFFSCAVDQETDENSHNADRYKE